jgi:hypothetical protein
MRKVTKKALKELSPPDEWKIIPAHQLLGLKYNFLQNSNLEIGKKLKQSNQLKNNGNNSNTTLD